ncbi:hypothetical protein Dshi_1910 [Dinoroseobacter shibae DFL 12 = DSM 16493]|jgi:hypothetical protein|uniref:Uncharacterized protein n=1 Tax=Dinoroseobacter shibae (strain DSM 16493 / NCIMB 14021 / DFL 12) TaxID=398580 RepID=A8LND9_DINSH|nr:hypothetical protein [Dinoroseobacter shibae]ABV93652.1 hypothetical protein Dshi_1910 [Dinoroseobacter shibae DFL 12 = DSM 16493]URF45104.1 hypothetical protein M8008_09890 [Dinoroseobacter shibae]URF49409.1 hypothetical protein M8007_09890 [Dinoroseobacter shibae]
MADDTNAALQALIKQVITLTETVEAQSKRLDGLHDFNTRILDEKKDLQRKLASPPANDEVTETRRLLDAINNPKRAEPDNLTPKQAAEKAAKDQAERQRLARLRASGIDPNNPVVELTRAEARDTHRYREMRELAALAGTTLRVVDNPNHFDPAQQGRPEIAQTRSAVIKDADNKRVYVRRDVMGSSNFRQQYSNLRAAGFVPVTWSDPSDLPDHIREQVEANDGNA